MPTMQWLKAEQKANHYHLKVWLDTSKIQANTTEPDPIYTKEYRFSATPPNGWVSASLNGTTYSDWQSYCLAEAQLLAQADYDALNPTTTALSVQGDVFTPA